MQILKKGRKKGKRAGEIGLNIKIGTKKKKVEKLKRDRGQGDNEG